MAGFFVYAHRGASAEAPENTLSAFRRALAAGADGVELDVHLSADGVPLVIHDDTLERTTTGQGAVAGCSAASLRSLDAGSWFAPGFAGEPLPTLEEALRLLVGRVRINIEIKEPQAGMAVLALLESFPAADVVISSFDLELLGGLRRVCPELPLAILHETVDWRRAVAAAAAVGACAFHPHVELVSRPLMTACDRQRLPVYPWTVDDPTQAGSLERIGVAGVFTNDPAGLRRFSQAARP